MGAYLEGLVWPRYPLSNGCGSLLLDVIACLPREDSALLGLHSFRSYADSHPRDNPLRTWRFSTRNGAGQLGISPRHLRALGKAVQKACSLGGYSTVEVLRRWEPVDQWDSTSLHFDLSWPHPYPTWVIWQQSDYARSPVWTDFRKRSEYVGGTGRSPNLDYVAAFCRNLGKAQHAEHAVGLLYPHLTSAVNSFAVWHRDVGAFAIDLLWAVAQIATGTGLFYLDPRMPQGPTLIAALTEAIRDGPEPYGGGRQELYWLREPQPERYGAPRLGYAALEGLAARVDDLAAAIAGVGWPDILEAAQRCTTCRFEELGEGGLLWTRSELDDCVDEFYLRLAEMACPDGQVT